jgi:hypothetical protein
MCSETLFTHKLRSSKMKKLAIFAIAILTVTLFVSNINAQTQSNPNKSTTGKNWVDSNGDGICDNFGTAAQGKGYAGRGYGKKDGTGNPVRPMDGTGYGAKAGSMNGTGVCTGAGNANAGGRGFRGSK